VMTADWVFVCPGVGTAADDDTAGGVVFAVEHPLNANARANARTNARARVQNSATPGRGMASL
jgi:molybdopterin-biosynthesis enzyme MoeA-like protein